MFDTPNDRKNIIAIYRRPGAGINFSIFAVFRAVIAITHQLKFEEVFPTD